MKIVAIGGGSTLLDDSEKPFSLQKTCEKIVSLANKKCPRFLYIGFNIRADYYFGSLKKIFSKQNCQCEYLRYSELSNEKTVKGKISRADIIFLPGGNTLSYMKTMNRFGIISQIKDAASKGTVIAGISAGAIMSFEYGHSDSRTKLAADGKNIYMKVKGLALAKGIISPHFSSSDRKFDIERLLKTCKKNTVAFGIDENASLVINKDRYEVITEDENCNIYRLFLKDGKLNQETLKSAGNLEELYKV